MAFLAQCISNPEGLLGVKTLRQPGVSPTSASGDKPDIDGVNPDIGSAMSSFGGKPDVGWTWPVRRVLARGGHSLCKDEPEAEFTLCIRYELPVSAPVAAIFSPHIWKLNAPSGLHHHWSEANVFGRNDKDHENDGSMGVQERNL